MNRVILMGNLTKDPEFKNIGTTNVVNFGIAINQVKQGGAKETTFIDVSAFGKTAENITKYFTKGKAILIEGRLKLDEWQDKTTHQKRSKLKTVAERFYFCGGNTQQAPQPAPAQQTAPQQGFGQNVAQGTTQAPPVAPQGQAPASPFV